MKLARKYILCFTFCSGDTFFGMVDFSYGNENDEVPPFQTGKTRISEKTSKEPTKSKDGTEENVFSGVVNTGSSDKKIDDKKTETQSEEETKIKHDINAYIIESYKAQGTRVVKELSVKLTKSIPEAKDRQEAYKKIQVSLELRSKKIGTDRMTETKRVIMEEFLDHMIELLDKKIEELD